jgi:hypothetical protein
MRPDLAQDAARPNDVAAPSSQLPAPSSQLLPRSVRELRLEALGSAMDGVWRSCRGATRLLDSSSRRRAHSSRRQPAGAPSLPLPLAPSIAQALPSRREGRGHRGLGVASEDWGLRPRETSADRPSVGPAARFEFDRDHNSIAGIGVMLRRSRVMLRRSRGDVEAKPGSKVNRRAQPLCAAAVSGEFFWACQETFWTSSLCRCCSFEPAVARVPVLRLAFAQEAELSYGAGPVGAASPRTYYSRHPSSTQLATRDRGLISRGTPGAIEDLGLKNGMPGLDEEPPLLAESAAAEGQASSNSSGISARAAA